MTDQSHISPTSFKNQLALLTFVDTLIKDRKDPGTTASNVEEVKKALLMELNEYINTHLVSLLDDSAQKELEVLLDRNETDEALESFFKKKIPDMEVEVASAMMEFRAAYLYKPEETSFADTADKIASEIPEIKQEPSKDFGGLTNPPPPAPIAK